MNEPLTEYHDKRKFEETPEPVGDGKGGKMKTGEHLRFVVQKHRASHLHYDFRLELDGVMKSWAVPKGPSLDPKMKRLAMMTEDHPLDYMTFEGTIPKGNYGAGEVIVWDHGLYHSAETDKADLNKRRVRAGLKKGHLDFLLMGKKLKGRYSLIKIKDDESGKNNAWLLVKHEDTYATTNEVLDDKSSVISGKEL
ncbi:hypothetical protein KW797_04640 [Candidatus Parcubacteria bacterium]|nr:hypothetical protein [Candidatus Parcubacteria bacterium]